MNTTKKADVRNLRINDRVTGTYHGVPFSGTVDYGDYSGRIGIKLDSPITVYGVERSGLSLDAYDRDLIETVTRGEEVECRHWQGHIFPRSK